MQKTLETIVNVSLVELYFDVQLVVSLVIL